MCEKSIYYLDGTAACFKSTILSTLRENNVCFTSSSDLTELCKEFPDFYSRSDGIQYTTIPWFSMYLSDLFLRKKIGNEYSIMCCDRSPIAAFVYNLVNKKGNKLSVQEVKKILPTWFIDYFNSSNVLFIIDSNITAVKERLMKRGGFDVDLATNEYFILQNNYFKAIAEVCNVPIIDINGRTFSDIYEFVVNWIEKS